MKNSINENATHISTILGKTNSEKEIIFKVNTSMDNEYFLSIKDAMLTLYNHSDEMIATGNNIYVSLKLNEDYYLKIETKNFNEEFEMICTPKNKITVPYPLNIENNGKDIPLTSEDPNKCPLTPSLITMNKRKGGTYIYSNTPEAMPLEVLDSIIMENKNLKGDCFVTIEHQNACRVPHIYMGYRIVNTGKDDVYVTVKNIGYQVDGSWLGEKSWMDYYGVKYEMNPSSFNERGRKWFKDYLNFDVNYEPHQIMPTTYRIPSGKFLYIMGGTTSDNLNHINVNNTADQKIGPGCCVNGNMLFTVLNGEAKGQLCAYVEPENIAKDNVTIQNLRKYGENDDLGGRIGDIDHHGVIDTNPIWIFNDATSPRCLPVKYYPYYGDLKDSYEPFEKIANCSKHEYIGDRWYTHLSSQLHHNYIGEDIVENRTIFNGKEILLTPNAANPAGKVWDFGNWMIEYQENCVFVNQGDFERTLQFNIINGGSLLYIIKDEDGNILKSGATFVSCEGIKPIFEIRIPGHSRKLISVQFVLAANNNGSVEHYVQLI